MRRPHADREEKRVAHGNETSKKRVTIRTGRLDASDPNQRRHLIEEGDALRDEVYGQ
jgi:hypothetical protein